MAVRYLKNQIKKNENITNFDDQVCMRLQFEDLDFTDQPQFINVGLFGKTVMSLKDGQCSFKGVKFLSTSYNHDKSLFHLVVFVYLDEENNQDIPSGVGANSLPPKHPKIIRSKISAPILVTSRKK